ncbi:MAG TPA: hypothetical protein VM370_01260 [Candidatus Thermoplasmatota archaeon]|nr:hypothetical protein [Candidatus Thermoplasmatota archaeon]
MANKMTLMGYGLLAWGVAAALASVPLMGTRFGTTLDLLALGSATGGLVLCIIGAAQYERY